MSVVLVQEGREIAHHPVGAQLRFAAQRRDRRLVVIGQFAAGGEHAGVVGGQAILCREALFLDVRQFRQGGAGGIDERIVQHQRQQVGIGEVAVIVGFFLAAHGAGFALVRVVQPGFLHHLAAGFDQVDLPLDLELDRPLDEAERVEILDSARVPSLGSPLGRTDTLASQRNEPSCMLPSQMPR
jgi:hypothetical protein